MAIHDWMKVLNFLDFYCEIEEDARKNFNKYLKKNFWACYFFNTDTDGEKLKEVFTDKNEKRKRSNFKDIEIKVLGRFKPEEEIKKFICSLHQLKREKKLDIESIKEALVIFIDSFKHKKVGKNLEEKM